MQEKGERHGIINIEVVNIKFHNKSWTAFGCQMIFRWSFVEQRTTYRSISSQKLPGFVVEFDIYNIYADDPMSLTSFLLEGPQFKYTGFYTLSKDKE